MKQEYIEAIKKQLETCEDIRMLDLVYQLLKKRNGGVGIC